MYLMAGRDVMLGSCRERVFSSALFAVRHLGLGAAPWRRQRSGVQPPLPPSSELLLAEPKASTCLTITLIKTPRLYIWAVVPRRARVEHDRPPPTCVPGAPSRAASAAGPRKMAANCRPKSFLICPQRAPYHTSSCSICHYTTHTHSLLTVQGIHTPLYAAGKFGEACCHARQKEGTFCPLKPANRGSYVSGDAQRQTR